MTPVELVGHLVTRDPYPFGIHDDDVIADIDVRGILGLVLASQAMGDFGRQAPQGPIRRVHHVPIANDIAKFDAMSLHEK